MTARFHTTRPDHWTQPRWKDPAQAYQRHGPLRGMDEPRRSWLMRIVGRN